MEDVSTPILAAILFTLGLMVGSFLNVVAYRLPLGGSVISPSRSFCPECREPIAWYDNIPLIGWVLLRGKCRNCGEPISRLYPATELLTGMLFALVAVQFGREWETLPALALITTCVVVTRTDLSHRIVPNRVVLIAAVAALPLHALAADSDLLEFALAGIGAFTFMLIAALAYPAGMGMGDVKLAGVLGLYLGISVVPALGIAFALGTVAGIVVLAREGMAAGRKTGVPFAPFMALGAVLALFIGEPVIDWYTDQFLNA